MTIVVQKFAALFVCLFFSFNYSLPHMDMRYDSGVHMHVIRTHGEKNVQSSPILTRFTKWGFKIPFCCSVTARKGVVAISFVMSLFQGHVD